MNTCKHVQKIRFSLNHSVLDNQKWKCIVCSSLEDIWACLSCSHVGCGKYLEEHIKNHYNATKHPISMNVSQKYVYCYECDNYILNDNAAGDVKILRNCLQAVSLQQCKDQYSQQLHNSNQQHHNKQLQLNHSVSTNSLNEVSRRRSYRIHKVSSNNLESLLQTALRNFDMGNTEEVAYTELWFRRYYMLAHFFNRWKMKCTEIQFSASNESDDMAEDSSIPNKHNKRLRSRTSSNSPLRSSKKHKPIIPGAVGLQNLGNTCYMNSILQVLRHLSQFSKGFIEENTHRKSSTSLNLKSLTNKEECSSSCNEMKSSNFNLSSMANLVENHSIASSFVDRDIVKNDQVKNNHSETLTEKLFLQDSSHNFAFNETSENHQDSNNILSKTYSLPDNSSSLTSDTTFPMSMVTKCLDVVNDEQSNNLVTTILTSAFNPINAVGETNLSINSTIPSICTFQNSNDKTENSTDSLKTHQNDNYNIHDSYSSDNMKDVHTNTNEDALNIKELPSNNCIDETNFHRKIHICNDDNNNINDNKDEKNINKNICDGTVNVDQTNKKNNIVDNHASGSTSVRILKTSRKRTPTKLSLSHELNSLLRIMWSGKMTMVSPHKMLYAVWNIIPFFRGYSQQDAQEFLSKFLDKVQSEIDVKNLKKSVKGGNNNVVPATTTHNLRHNMNCVLRSDDKKDNTLSDINQEQVPTNSRDFVADVDSVDGDVDINASKFSEDIVTQLFQGELISQVHCLMCGYKSNSREAFMDLSLEFPIRFHTRTGLNSSNNLCKLEEMLRLFMQVEKLDGKIYACENCNSSGKNNLIGESVGTIYSEAEKRFFISKLPNVLRLHLKRFMWSGRSSKGKISVNVAFPYHLDISEFCHPDVVTDSFKYALSAVVMHHGRGFGSGHYTAYCWNNDTDSWLHCNDAKMHGATMEDVHKAQAYILVYTKVSSPLSTYTSTGTSTIMLEEKNNKNFKNSSPSQIESCSQSHTKSKNVKIKSMIPRFADASRRLRVENQGFFSIKRTQTTIW